MAHHVEGKRVPSAPCTKVVFHDGRQLTPGLTVAEAGIAPLDHIRVEYSDAQGAP